MEKETIMNLVLIPENDPKLKQPSEPWDFRTNGDPTELIAAMAKVMLNPTTKGIGLAAPQVGIMKNLFLMGTDDELVACINPKIIELIGKSQIYLEGCLSFPNLWVHVKRNSEILVEYQTTSGELVKTTLSGIKARVFLHEYDHLLGITFDERCAKVGLSLAKKRRAKVARLQKKTQKKLASR